MPRWLKLVGTALFILFGIALLLSPDISTGGKLLFCLIVVGYRMNVLADQLEQTRVELARATAQLRTQIEQRRGDDYPGD